MSLIVMTRVPEETQKNVLHVPRKKKMHVSHLLLSYNLPFFYCLPLEMSNT